MLEGVAVGIAVAVALFLVNYSRARVIRHATTRVNHQSHVMRPRLYEQLLEQRGDSFAIVELQGFIFFGTAYTLVEEIKARLDHPSRLPLQYLLLDFRLVTGIDSSATLSFSRLMQIIESREMHLVLTHLAPAVQRQLEKEVLVTPPDSAPRWRIFPTMVEGIAWCEEQMIAVFADMGLVAESKTLLEMLDDLLPGEEDEMDWLEGLNPLVARPGPRHEERLAPYVERVDAAAGDVLIRKGQKVTGMYFIESGQVVAQNEDEDGSTQQFVVMQRGTAFGEVGVYTGQKANATVIARTPAALIYLTSANLKRIEEEDAPLAIAIHRLIADTLGRKLSHATIALEALQR